MSEADDRLNDYSQKATMDDVNKISGNIDGMKRGPIAKIWGDVKALRRLIMDPKAARGAKLIAIGALVYLVSPIDAVPDVIPVVGLLDDAAVIVAAVAKLASELKKYRND